MGSSPLMPPAQPFASARAVSPRPSVVTDSPNVPFMRGGDRTLSPVATAGRLSPVNDGYQTPPEYLSTNSMSRNNSAVPSPAYNSSPQMAAASPAGSGNKISAAAFRRPNMRPAGSSTLNVADDGVADVSPLNVRKRSLPNVPLVARLSPLFRVEAHYAFLALPDHAEIRTF